MHLRTSTVLFEPQKSFYSVKAISQATQNLCIVTNDNKAHIFNTAKQEINEFSLKPNSKNKRNLSFTVLAISFSCDGSRIACAQSDNIVYVYKLGDKVTICNKFETLMAVNSIVWPASNKLYFCTLNGSMFCGDTRKNKFKEIFSSTSRISCLCFSLKLPVIFAGMSDGVLYKFNVRESETKYTKFASIESQIYSLECLDKEITAVLFKNGLKLFNNAGKENETYEFPNLDVFMIKATRDGKQFLVSGLSVLLLFSYDEKIQSFCEISRKELHSYYHIKHIAWSTDMTEAYIGTSTGLVQCFNICLKQTRIEKYYEIIQSSPSSIVFVFLKSGERIVVNSKFGYKIVSTKLVLNKQYLVVCTQGSIIFLSIKDKTSSEVHLQAKGNERYFCDSDKIFAILSEARSEILVVQFNASKVLASLKTKIRIPNTLTLSIRFEERPKSKHRYMSNKCIAYLKSSKVINLYDIETTEDRLVREHENKIDWLELSSRGDYLLYRDKQRTLFLTDLYQNSTKLLSENISYVQWVPFTEVIVTQDVVSSGKTVSVWYSATNLSEKHSFKTNADIIDLCYTENEASILLSAVDGTEKYILNQEKVNFASYLEDMCLEKAHNVLKSAAKFDTNISLWKRLLTLCFDKREVFIAHDCLINLRQYPKAFLLKKICYKVMKLVGLGMNYTEAKNHYLVQGDIEWLLGNLLAAERFYLTHSCADGIRSVVHMYNDMHKYEDSMRFAQANGLLKSEIDSIAFCLRQRCEKEQNMVRLGEFYENCFLKSKSREDFEKSIEIYLDAHQPIKAFNLFKSAKQRLSSSLPTALVVEIASCLKKLKFYNKAAEAYNEIRDVDNTIACFELAENFSRLLELAKKKFPSRVVEFEEKLGFTLMAHSNFAAAIDHFVQSGNSTQAIKCAINGKQFNRAFSMIKDYDLLDLDPKTAKKFLFLLAQKDVINAEKYLVTANDPRKCIEHYIIQGKWEKAFAVTDKHLTSSQIRQIFLEQAKILYTSGRYEEAEKIFLKIEAYDELIRLYRMSEKFDDMLRIVSVFRKDELSTCLLSLAKMYEGKLNLDLASKYYIRAKDFSGAIKMWLSTTNSETESFYNYQQAIKISQLLPKEKEEKNHEAAKICLRYNSQFKKDYAFILNFGIANQVIEYFIDISDLVSAKNVVDACTTGQEKEMFETSICFQEGLRHEDLAEYELAESYFLKAGRPKEVIDMYIHQNQFDKAHKIAKLHCSQETSNVIIKEAEFYSESGNKDRAKELYLSLHRPDLVLEMYKNESNWAKCIEFSQVHFPSRLKEFQAKAKNEHRNGTICESESKSTNMKETIRYIEGSLEAKSVAETMKHISLITPSEYKKISDDGLRRRVIKIWEAMWHMIENKEIEEKKKLLVILAFNFEETKCYIQAGTIYKSLSQNVKAIKCFISGNRIAEAEDLAQSIEEKQLVLQAKSAKTSVVKTDKVLTSTQSIVLDLIDKKKYVEVFQIIEDKLLNLGLYYTTIALNKINYEVLMDQQVALLLTKLSYFFSLENQDHRNDFELKALLQNIAHKFLSITREQENSKYFSETSLSLVRALYNFSKDRTIKKLLICCVFYYYRIVISKMNTPRELELYLSLLLIYYTDFCFPVDKAYFLSGLAASRLGLLSKSFLFNNTFLDILDYIDDNDFGSRFDFSDFSASDFPNINGKMLSRLKSNSLYLNSQEADLLREEVLEMAMQNEAMSATGMVTKDWLKEVKYEVSNSFPTFVRKEDSANFVFLKQIINDVKAFCNS